MVGLIDVFDVRERDYNEVRWFLPEAGRTVADALRNADLLAGLRRGNSALRELVELGDRLNEAGTLEELARAVAERLRDVLAAEDCDIWQVDGAILRCLASVDSRGWDADEVGSERQLATYEATVAALEANEPLVIGDLAAADIGEPEKQAYRRWGFHSMVSLPLVVEGRPIGLIDVFDARVRDFTVHLDLIRNVGRLLAGSFEKAMLVERLEGGNEDLRLLVDSGLEFGATLDVDSVLLTVAERIVQVSQADLCDVLRLDGDEVEILLAIGEHWEDEPEGKRYPLRDYCTFLEALETHRPVATLDLFATPGMTERELTDAEEWGYRASLDVPLVSHGGVIGFISLMNREVRGFAREEVVVGLAQVAGQAIANAGLYRELDDNLRRMALVSESALELTSSLDQQATLLATARRLCEAIGVSECEITIIEGSDLHTLMRVSGGEVDEEWMGQRLALADAAVSREVIETKRPTVVGSLRDPRLTPVVMDINRDFERKSWATLPLIVKDRVIGTVELVESGAERTFTQAEIDTAAAICHAAALAIDNAALFAREQQTTRETQLLNDIAARTAASLDLEEVVKAAVDELGQLMEFEEYGLLLLDGAKVGHVIGSRPAAEALIGLELDAFEPGFVERIAAEGVLVVRLPEDLPPLAGSPAIEGHRRSRHHRAAVRHRPARRARPEQRPARCVRERRPPPAAARRHAALPGDQERPAVRRDQAHAPRQPQGAEFGPERQGLLHPGPRRPRRRLHGDARQAARLAGGRAGAAGRGGLPSRHRQDQHLRPRAPQARPSQPAGVGGDAPAPRGERRHHPPSLSQGPRARRAPPPRALRRPGLSGRPRR